MNTLTRIRNIESKITKRRESVRQGIPIVELSPEEKVTWPKRLPYPILGGISGK